MNTIVIKAVETASEKWRASFNSGDANGCAQCYENEALMVAKPFGEFRGQHEIQQFWEKLINDGFKDVRYIDPKITVIDEKSAELSAGWEMNNASGVISRELWVLQEDGSALLREDHFEANS